MIANTMAIELKYILLEKIVSYRVDDYIKKIDVIRTSA